MPLSWTSRPTEVANLLNPAFCSLLLREAVLGYLEEGAQGMPYAVAFIVLPIVLHKATRDAFPASISTKLHAWLQENQVARVGLSNRAKGLIPYSREALIYALSSSLLVVSREGLLVPAKGKVKLPKWEKDSEVSACSKRAHFLGRWFARAGDTATVFALLGIVP
jgi:hypothetical protein